MEVLLQSLHFVWQYTCTGKVLNRSPRQIGLWRPNALIEVALHEEQTYDTPMARDDERVCHYALCC